MGKFSGISKLIKEHEGEIKKKIGDHVKENREELKDKVKEKVSEKKTNLNEKGVDTSNMNKKELLVRNIGEKAKRIKDSIIDTTKTDNTAYKQQFQEKISGYKDRLINPTTYKYLTYLILFINICCLLLLHFNVNEFYRRDEKKIDIKINNNIFYIYSFLLFLIVFQLYILFNIDIKFTTFQKIIEFINITLFIIISYKLYDEILNINNKDCPAPNIRKCIPNQDINSPNEIENCSKTGPFQCGDNDYKQFSDGDLKDSGFKNNFYEVPGINVVSCGDSDFQADQCNNNASFTSTNICNSGSCTIEECCMATGEENPLTKRIKELFNELIKGDEDKIKTLEDEVANLSGGSKAGPPGPPGPPGTPGSDTRPESTPTTQFSNILCPNEPGGICKDGQSRCNDKGMCEGFALISLQDKIDLKLKYKDLNNNAYKADNLMNNLENYLLNSLK
jgi:hypothetical protein